MKVRATDWLAYAGTRLGWPGLAGLAALVLALLTWQGLSRPLQAALEDARSRLEGAGARAAVLAPPPPPPLAATLPAASDAPAIIGRLFATARRAGLTLDEGGYRSSLEGGGTIQRLQISLPLAGTWPALRTFIADSLTANPSLVLEGLNLSRETLAEESLKTQLRFSLYLREASLPTGGRP